MYHIVSQLWEVLKLFFSRLSTLLSLLQLNLTAVDWKHVISFFIVSYISCNQNQMQAFPMLLSHIFTALFIPLLAAALAFIFFFSLIVRHAGFKKLKKQSLLIRK